jgi:hypothetical protein
MAQQMATRYVNIDSHVRLPAAQFPRACDRRNVVSERRRVHGIPQLQQRRQLLQSSIIQSIEVGKITRLVDFVDIGFFRCEVDVFADFVADGAEEIIVD